MGPGDCLREITRCLLTCQNLYHNPQEDTAMTHAFADTLQAFATASGMTGNLYSLPALVKQFPNINPR